jgi:hypothetical protein
MSHDWRIYDVGGARSFVRVQSSLKPLRLMLWRQRGV